MKLLSKLAGLPASFLRKLILEKRLKQEEKLLKDYDDGKMLNIEADYSLFNKKEKK